MVERVIVAVDGGPASDAALSWVIDRASTRRMRIEVTTIAGLDAELPEGAETGYHTATETALAAAVDRVKAALPKADVRGSMRAGVPHEELVNASADADLLVIGTNKTSPAVGIVHGTLPLKVAGRADCTTVVVPVNWQPGSGDVVAGWSDDATAEAALDFAAAEAEERGVGLTIVHTWSMPPTSPLDGAGSAVVVQELIAAHRELLAGAAHRIEREHPRLAVTHVLHAGSAAVAIVRAAAGASLVVVGSRGRGVIAGFFLGSVSHDVLLNMPAPVAVIPKKSEPVDVYPDLVDDDI